MTLYQIIKALQNTTGSKAKQAILEEHKDNELLKAYLKATYDPKINYYIKMIPKGPYPWNLDNSDYSDGKFEFSHIIEEVIGELSTRKVTGKAAVKRLHDLLCSLSDEGKELVEYILKRDIKANIAEGTILKVWPDLFFIPPYQRCSTLSDKIRAVFAKLEWFYVQVKLDGAFAYLVNPLEGLPEAMTRAGSIYPTWLAEKLSKGVSRGCVLAGEMLVYRDGKLLDRKTGNGILNSILQGEDDAPEPESIDVKMVAWDCLTEDEFDVGYSSRTYEERLFELSAALAFAENVSEVRTWKVKSMKEAFGIYKQLLSEGEEGAVGKNPEAPWKDCSSGDPNLVKLKLEFEAEYVILDYYEGEGKATGSLGGVTVATQDMLLKVNVGSGFSDDERKTLWRFREELPGKVVTVKANAVVDSKSKKTKSLFLPIFVEVRLDKDQGDSLKRVLEQEQAAKECA